MSHGPYTPGSFSQTSSGKKASKILPCSYIYNISPDRTIIVSSRMHSRKKCHRKPCTLVIGLAAAYQLKISKIIIHLRYNRLAKASEKKRESNQSDHVGDNQTLNILDDEHNVFPLFSHKKVKAAIFLLDEIEQNLALIKRFIMRDRKTVKTKNRSKILLGSLAPPAWLAPRPRMSLYK